MTIQDLINTLNSMPDKSLPVMMAMNNHEYEDMVTPDMIVSKNGKLFITDTPTDIDDEGTSELAEMMRILNYQRQL